MCSHLAQNQSFHVWKPTKVTETSENNSTSLASSIKLFSPQDTVRLPLWELEYSPLAGFSVEIPFSPGRPGPSAQLVLQQHQVLTRDLQVPQVKGQRG